MESKDRFPLVRKILATLGLSSEAIDDIVERILDWLSAKDEPAIGAAAYPFHLRDDFLSPAEANFYQVLRMVTGQQVVALAKVNLNDLFFAQTGDARRNRAVSNRIDRKHVDFLLCDSSTLRPVLGIELDDRSHERPDRIARDELVDGVFAAAGLPLLRVPVRQGYAPEELVALIQPCFGAVTTPTETKPAEPTQATTIAQSPACPKCGAVMALRTAKSGLNAGGQFWGCTSYPRCRTTLPV
jgi:very-short-patch-repair endonuclease